MIVDSPDLTEREQLAILLNYSWTVDSVDRDILIETILLSAIVAGIDKSFGMYPVHQRIIAYALNAYYWPSQDVAPDRFRLHFAIVKYAMDRDEKTFFAFAANQIAK